jgi:hypothetical protein
VAVLASQSEGGDVTLGCQRYEFTDRAYIGCALARASTWKSLFPFSCLWRPLSFGSSRIVAVMLLVDHREVLLRRQGCGIARVGEGSKEPGNE